MSDDGALTARAFKDAVYEQFVRITKALASPVRLEIVDVLAQGERTVDVLAREVGQSLANTSQHLRSLKEARLVDTRRDGTFVHYRLADPQVIDVWRAVRADGEVVLLDVRPDAEYRAGHLPGARSIPVGELAERLAELPPDATVVAYCRGPYCVMSYDALAILRDHGRRGVRLAEGPPDWRAAGRPVQGGHGRG
jgi:rhodanese-related sulfurtransferase